jgi:hypothetical protein
VGFSTSKNIAPYFRNAIFEAEHRFVKRFGTAREAQSGM